MIPLPDPVEAVMPARYLCPSMYRESSEPILLQFFFTVYYSTLHLNQHVNEKYIDVKDDISIALVPLPDVL